MVELMKGGRKVIIQLGVASGPVLRVYDRNDLPLGVDLDRVKLEEYRKLESDQKGISGQPRHLVDVLVV